MTLYIYEASDKAGTPKKGEFEAHDREAVVAFLTKKQLIPITIRVKKEAQKGQLLRAAVFERITPQDRVLLFRNLATALKAGVSVMEALDILIVDAQKKKLYDILVRTKSNLSQGQQLSKSFAEFPDVFSPVVVGMVEAGERSGKLDETLDELARYLLREYDLGRKVKSALAYPTILLTAASSVIVLMFFFTIPRLEILFSQIDAPLPLLTRIFVGISHAMRANLFVDGFFILLIIAAIIYVKRTPRGRRIILNIVTIIPIAHSVLQKVALVRFTRTLASAISSGLTLVEGLAIASQAVGNEQYRAALHVVREEVQTGLPLSGALAKYPKLFPHFLTSLVTVGEKTGSTDEILRTFADFYDAEVDYTLKNLTNILEPLLLLGMGFFIAIIAVAMLFPIYRFVGSFV